MTVFWRKIFAPEQSKSKIAKSLQQVCCINVMVVPSKEYMFFGFETLKPMSSYGDSFVFCSVACVDAGQLILSSDLSKVAGN
jgi:hypothetical protein